MVDATVIAFPQTARAGEAERLRRAAERLQAALSAPSRALGDWRFAMTELGIGVAGLSQSLTRYQDSLSGVETRLAALRADTTGLATSPAAHPPAITGATAHAAE